MPPPEVKCANCAKVIENPKKGQRFCSDPGSTCRQDFHRMRLPRAAVDIAIGRWFDDNREVLVAALLPAIVSAVKAEIRAAVRSAAGSRKPRKRQ